MSADNTAPHPSAAAPAAVAAVVHSDDPDALAARNAPDGRASVLERLNHLEQQVSSVQTTSRKSVTEAITGLMLDKQKWHLVMEQAKVLADSGVIKGNPNPAAVAAIILRGLELGISPVAAAQNIEVVEGELVVRGRLMLQLIQERTHGTICTLATDPRNSVEGFDEYAEWIMARPDEAPRVREILECPQEDRTEREKEVLASCTFRFGRESAEKAGLLRKKNYEKWAPDMYVWRAFARGARTKFADVAGGAYIREEMTHRIEGTPEHQAAKEAAREAAFAAEHERKTKEVRDLLDQAAQAWFDTDPQGHREKAESKFEGGFTDRDVVALLRKQLFRHMMHAEGLSEGDNRVPLTKLTKMIDGLRQTIVKFEQQRSAYDPKPKQEEREAPE